MNAYMIIKEIISFIWKIFSFYDIWKKQFRKHKERENFLYVVDGIIEPGAFQEVYTF